MSSFRPRRPSAALVVSVIALIVALGGTAYAGGLVPGKNTVGTKQLKKNAVTTSKIKNGQVTNSKLANGAVTASKINPTGLTVPNALHANTATTAGSATSAATATNATTAGTASALASIAIRQGTAVTAPACGAIAPCAHPSDTLGTVTCPAGMVAISGGAHTSNGGEEISESQPLKGTGSPVANEWEVFVDNFNTTADTFNAIVSCAKINAVDDPSGLSKLSAPGR